MLLAFMVFLALNVVLVVVNVAVVRNYRKAIHSNNIIELFLSIFTIIALIVFALVCFVIFVLIMFFF